MKDVGVGVGVVGSKTSRRVSRISIGVDLGGAIEIQIGTRISIGIGIGIGVSVDVSARL